MRTHVLGLSILASGCSSEPSRLDGLTARGSGSATRVRAIDAAPALDEADQDLRRRLREASARPLDDTTRALDAAMLGRTARPFGPLASLAPRMTRAEVMAAVPGAHADGAIVWVPTGIDETTVEISFDREDRLGEVVYRMPLAARPLLVAAWGPDVPQVDTWFDRANGWRARLREDAIKREVAVALSGFTPFADVVGRGPDGLAESAPMIGATPPALRERFGARLIGASASDGFVELAMPHATDVCASPTELTLELDPAGTVKRVRLLQCYDDDAITRRSALATMERSWGTGVATRTPDDRLVLTWTLPGRRLEAQQVQHGSQSLWEISIRAK